MYRCLFIFALASLFFDACAQEQDNNELRNDSIERSRAVKKAIYSDARKAAIMSAVIPGLGQIYNRKYWKAPVIYAGIGGLGYMFSVNNRQYQFFRQHLLGVVADPSAPSPTGFSQEQLQAQKVYYKKNRDFAAIGMGLIYLLNIIDANVDAHLKSFDVSDDLSVAVDPYYLWACAPLSQSCMAGVTLKLKFR